MSLNWTAIRKKKKDNFLIVSFADHFDIFFDGCRSSCLSHGIIWIMIGTRRRQDLTSGSFCSSCATVTVNTRWSEISSTSPFSPPLLSPSRPIIKSAHRFIVPLVPPAWSPITQISPKTALRDFCTPRPEPRPPADVLNRSSLRACSPSLAKFSRTSTGQHVSISTSTTTLPSTVHLHPPMAYLTVNGLKTQHHRPHQYHCRHRR